MRRQNVRFRRSYRERETNIRDVTVVCVPMVKWSSGTIDARIKAVNVPALVGRRLPLPSCHLQIHFVVWSLHHLCRSQLQDWKEKSSCLETKKYLQRDPWGVCGGKWMPCNVPVCVCMTYWDDSNEDKKYQWAKGQRWTNDFVRDELFPDWTRSLLLSLGLSV